MQHSAEAARVIPTWKIQDAQPASSENAKPSNSRDPRTRRRKSMPCETCYKKKIKCEFNESKHTCTPCMRRSLKCKPISGKGTRDGPRRSRYVRNLEERLKKTESLLRAAGILVETANLDEMSDVAEDLNEDDSAVEDESDTSTGSRDSSGSISHESDVTTESATAKRASPTSVTNRSFHHNPPISSNVRKRSNTGKGGPPVYKPDKGCSLYLGRSTPLSILTREGVEWVKSKSGEANSLSSLLSGTKFDSPWAYWRPDVFYDVFSSKVYKPLPPRAEVFSLLKDYFRTVNLMFPLYHEETFMQLVEWQYTQQTCDDAARWASINIILALAHEYRFSNSQKSEKDREKAWLYYKNALSVFPELVMRRTDLLSVQALLGMALFLRGNSSTQSTVPVVTAAIRSSHRMGLHREIPRPYLGKIEQEQRRNVFWIAYVIDQSISIRLGNAPTQHFDDFDVEIPSDENAAGLVMADNKLFFPRLCRIAVLRSRIYRLFYSARALENKSTADICEMIHQLHAELDNWKSECHFDILLKRRGSGEDFLAGFASAGLFLVYYNSLIMIHRLPMLINFIYQSRADSVPEFDLKLILSQSSSSAAICVQAARDTLKLVNNLPWGDIAWIWSLLYYVFLAVMTIFANILRNSQQATAKDDLQSLNMAATFFATLVPADGPCNYARFMTRMSTTFERIARTVLERDQKPHPDSKRKVSSKPRPSSTSDPDTNGKSRPESTATNNNQTSSTSTNIDIPNNLEGLPPINSSGYVVRESPPPSTRSDDNSDTSQSHSTHLSNNLLPDLRQQQQQQHPSNLTTNVNQYHTQQQHPYATENIPMPFPLPALDESSFTFTQPELWQIPLTADWEFGFGGQFLGGMFGQPGTDSNNGNVDSSALHAQSYMFQGATGPQSIGTAAVPETTAVPVPVPVSSVPMMSSTYPTVPGYPNGSQCNGIGAGVAPEATPGLNPAAMWMGGSNCYGNPY
ncbi:fungal-specific transcription factor domain-containing protein [Aspergillus pseudodeflectus]|uniref:Fungal-specific transcription factor domain-containing protein n=1 Tax=Aspergillus pseudodeflectus TaxID=176178 RepID=A0ABR4KFD3_9EURO